MYAQQPSLTQSNNMLTHAGTVVTNPPINMNVFATSPFSKAGGGGAGINFGRFAGDSQSNANEMSKNSKSVQFGKYARSLVTKKKFTEDKSVDQDK